MRVWVTELFLIEDTDHSFVAGVNETPEGAKEALHEVFGVPLDTDWVFNATLEQYRARTATHIIEINSYNLGK